MRVIFGDDHTEVAAGGGYYCQACWAQPKYDYHWTKAQGCEALSGWFCANCGQAYDIQRMVGLIAFVDKLDPAASAVMNTRMPTGPIANMLSVMKIRGVIRLSECPVTKEDAIKAGRTGPAIKN